MAEIELKALEEELFSEMLDDYTLSLMEPHERRQRLGMYLSLHLTYLGGSEMLLYSSLHKQAITDPPFLSLNPFHLACITVTWNE